MNPEKLDRRDIRLIAICAVIAAVSLFVGVRYFFLAFPESSIEFRTTREGSLPLARAFVSSAGLDPSGYRHASVFGFDDTAKVFLERELGVEESGRLLDSTVRLWRWEHRWFRPLQKEEIQVEVTTKGEIVGFDHLLPEEAPGADLPADEARRLAEGFLSGTMGRPLGTLTFVEGSLEKRPHRTDHTFTWKLAGSEVKGADYRIEVGVAGDRPARYLEYLKVPDTWQRDYATLRSKNEVAGQFDTVLMLLTAVAMLVILVQRIVRGDVRWRTAAVLGAVTSVLQLLSALNEIPADIYAYDTTTSFTGFLVQRLLGAFLSSLSFGAAIFLIAAAAETLYRTRFPRFLSVSSLLRPRALRTKEYFIASVVGITLTFFFFAYENVFYIIANRLGAWAPREIAYSDLLSTAFPWIYVLFIGWFPAISEEFVSRMFSIPFFERFLRFAGPLRLPLAMVVSAFIWGFGHAGYPNQPWFIRGLEVGLAGMVFGLVLMRFGILSVVICHFSVDALYTAFVLIRSPNPYYVISGTLSAGVFVILFVAALVAYLVRGGFAAEATNEAEGVAPEPPPAPRGVPASAAGGGATARYRPLAGRTIAIGLVLAAAGFALRFAPVERFGAWSDFATTRPEAKRAAAAFLAGCGHDVSALRSAAMPMDRIAESGGTDAAYLLKTGGTAVAEEVYRDLAPTPIWRVRFFLPGQQEEFSVSVDPRSAAGLGFRRTLPDDAPGATLEKPEALALAASFLKARGLDPATGELKEQTQEDKKARRDHTLVWEFPIAGAGEAKLRHEVTVQGGAVGGWARGVKIPEDWERDREKQTAVTIVLRYLKIPLLGVLAGLAVVLFIVKIRAREIPWKGALAGGLVAAVAMVVLTANQFDRFWAMVYPTAVPKNTFMATLVVIFLVTAILILLGGTLACALAASLYPGAARSLRGVPARLPARDALVAGVVGAGVAVGISALSRILDAALPSGRLITGVAWPESLGGNIPILALGFGLVYRTIFLTTLGAIAVAVVRTWFRAPAARIGMGALFVVAFLPGAAREPAEFLRAGLFLLIALGGTILVVRYFLGANPLSWAWCAWFIPGLFAAAEMLRLSAGAYRAAGIAALVILALPGVWLLWGALAGPTRREEA